MKAMKENKVYAITETEKVRYIEQGFDIFDDAGKLLEYGRGKTVSIEEYERVKKELDELKATRTEDKAEAESDDKDVSKTDGKKTAGK